MIGFAAGWRQVAACLVLMAAAAMITSGFSVMAVPLGEEFQPSRMVLMLAMTITSAVSGLMAPYFGGLMDRSSVRRLMFAGAGLMIAGYFALTFTTEFWQVLAIYGLLIAPANILIGPIAATVLLSRWFLARRGAALGIAIMGVSLGGFVYPPLIQALLGAFEWREAFRVFAVILCFTTLPAIALVVERPADRGLHPDGADREPEGMRPPDGAPQVSAKAVLTDSTFWIASAIFAVVMSGMAGMVTSLVPLAVDEGETPAAAALLISIFAAGGFLAKLIFAAIADALNPRHLLFLAIAGFALGMVCLSRAESGYWIIALGVVLIGLCGGLMVPLQSLLVPRIFGAHVVGRVTGMMSLLVLCVLLMAPPLFGLVHDLTHSYDLIVLAFAALAAATMLLVPYMRLHPKAGPLGTEAVAAVQEG